jgi:hypothetical protein
MGDVIHTSAFGAKVIHLTPAKGSPSFVDESHPVTPRRHFGLLGTGGLERTLDAALGTERPEDRSQQSRIKAAAREARNALDGKHICPSLVLAVANRATGLAVSAEQLAAEAKSLGLLKAAVTLRDLAHIAETLAAEIEAEQSA